MARSRKLNLKSILKVAVFAALAILLIGGISSCFGDDTDTVSIFKFERGELDSKGEYVESKRAVYTKTAFKCQGLEIIPDFDAHASYDVYYYDADDNFLDSVTGLTKKYTYDHPFATHARVVIYPEVPEDESEEDYEIPFYKVYSVANKLNITVSEKQSSKYSDNLYNDSNHVIGTFVSDKVGDKLEISDLYAHKISEKIITKYLNYDVYVKSSVSNAHHYTASLLASTSDDIILESELVNLREVEENL